MPRLSQVLPDAFLEVAAENPDVEALLDVEVKTIQLNNGSPCDGHASMFSDWPGKGRHVRQWFVLVNGKAVGVDEIPDSPWLFPVINYDGLD